MPIACTTVASAMAVKSQLKENLNIELQESIKIYRKFLSKSRHTSKGP